MTEFEKDENRQLVDLAVAAGRHFMSPQTGYVHYTYHHPMEESHHSIPFYENFLYILALLRKRTVEDVTIARGLLDKLLCFQCPNGSFPVYMHDYPLSKDRFMSIHVLPVFYWMLVEFGPVLGEDLKSRLELASHKLLDDAALIAEQYTLALPNKARLGSVLAAWGKHFHKDEMIKIGTQLLLDINTQLYCPYALGEYLLGMQLYPEGPWEDMAAHLEKVWFQSAKAFAGPCEKDFQLGYEPQVSLYDFFMGYLTHGLSKRALEPHPMQLQAALIQPMHIKMNSHVHPWRLTTLSVDQGLHPASDRGKQALRLLWGDGSRCHSLVCEGGNVERIECRQDEDSAELWFHLGEPLPQEDRESKFEVQFFLDIHEDLRLDVQGQRSMIFYLGDTLHIKSGEIHIELSMSLENGVGEFLGHISRGNRPSQNGIKGKDRFSAFDWIFGIRTLRRPHPCCLKTKVKIYK